VGGLGAQKKMEKSTRREMKNSLKKPKSRYELMDKITSKFKDRTVEVVYIKKKA
jgi:hypothetical protein